MLPADNSTLDNSSSSQNQPSFSAYLTLIAGLLSISFAPIFIRWGETELGATATVFNRFFVFVVVFGFGRLISARLTPAPEEAPLEPPTRTQWFLLGSVGLISICSLVLWATSLQYTTVAKSMLLNNMTPIFTSLGSWILFGRKFSRRFLMGMAIALAGAVALGLEDLDSADGLLVGDLLALLSAVFLGAYFLVVEQLRSRFSATTILLWRCAIGGAVLLPIALSLDGQIFPVTNVAIFGVLGLGIISEGSGQRLLADSMERFSSSFISLFLLLEPIVSAMLAWLIFQEAFGSTTWLGFAVILTGIYLAQSSDSAAHSGESQAIAE